MRNFLNSKIKEIKPSGIRKFFDIANQIEDCISLGVGEPDFDTPWRIREEGIYALEKGKIFYTSNSGLFELREAISQYLKRKYDLEYKAEGQILVTIGGSEAIDVALRCLVEDGDEVILPTPCYVSYGPCATLAGAKVVEVSLSMKDGFVLTEEKLRAAITPQSKILLLNYPNNPTGAILKKEDLEAIARVCLENDLFVISDEIYSELCYGFSHYSIAGMEGMQERTLVINGFSKTFSMTGWRLGYVCGPEPIIKEMTKLHQYAIMCAPTTSQFAAIEALKNCDSDVEKMRLTYADRRNYVVRRLEEMGLSCFMPEGAFYVFPSIEKFKLTSEEFCLELLEQEHVVVVPGTAFGDSGEGFIRISYAYSLEDLKTALDRLEHFILKFGLR